MIKTITITIVPDSTIVLPGHLKKPDVITLNIEGLQQLEAIKIMANTFANLVNDFEAKMNLMIENLPKQTIN